MRHTQADGSKSQRIISYHAFFVLCFLVIMTGICVGAIVHNFPIGFLTTCIVFSIFNRFRWNWKIAVKIDDILRKTILK